MNSRGRFATPANFPPQDCSPYSHVHAYAAKFYPVPNPLRFATFIRCKSEDLRTPSLATWSRRWSPPLSPAPCLCRAGCPTTLCSHPSPRSTALRPTPLASTLQAALSRKWVREGWRGEEVVERGEPIYGDRATLQATLCGKWVRWWRDDAQVSTCVASPAHLGGGVRCGGGHTDVQRRLSKLHSPTPMSGIPSLVYSWPKV
jgi:hypothetical protein